MGVSVMALTTGLCPLQLTSPGVHQRNSAAFVQGGVRRVAVVMCSAEQVSSSGGTEASGGGHSNPPKLEPFSQSRLSHSMRDRSFLQKAEEAISERCMGLEGEAGYKCWEALFEYENIKEAAETECNVAQSEDRDEACRPLERFEHMVRQSGGVNSLIDNVRMVAKIKEANKQKKVTPSENDWVKTVASAAKEDKLSQSAKPHEHEFTEDGGIPKTEAEIEAENDGLLPESAFTRVLRRRGSHHED